MDPIEPDNNPVSSPSGAPYPPPPQPTPADEGPAIPEDCEGPEAS